MISSNHSELKLSKLGCGVNLLRFTCFISVTGIIFSTLAITGGIAAIIMATTLQSHNGQSFGWSHIGVAYLRLISGILYIIGGLTLVLSLGWMVMNCLLLRRCSQKNIHGIEKITTIVNYLIGSFEIMAISLTLVSYLCCLYHYYVYIFILTVLLIFESLKILGLRKHQLGMVKVYIIYKYFCSFCFITVIMFKNFQMASNKPILIWIILIVSVVSIMFIIQDIGYTVILYSIRANNNTTRRQT